MQALEKILEEINKVEEEYFELWRRRWSDEIQQARIL